MIFIRHPAVATAGICYGRLDVDCAPGVEDAVAALLSDLPPAPALYSSPARRCRILADRIAARDGIAVVSDPRLRELDFGEWEGRPWSAIERTESDRWAADPFSVPPPGGETFSALLARVGAALAEAPPEAVIVTHAGPIRAARMILAGESFAQVFARPVPHCTPLTIGGSARERLASGAAGR